MQLNDRAAALCKNLIEHAELWRVRLIDPGYGVPVIDCGIEAPGSLQAGLELAKICLGGLGHVSLTPAQNSIWSGPGVSVRTDYPVAACLASQYAGWQVADDGYFAMGSGPMRAAAAKEPLFDEIGFAEQTSVAVGVLESRKLPSQELAERIAVQCDVAGRQLTLLVAPTGSLAGALQIVARSVETALHKLHELKFDLSHVVAGFGWAPLPPVGQDDLVALGRTNDAILYGCETTLWVRCADDAVAAVIDQVPSSASADFGRPFGEIFAEYEHDFYKIDPHLFSPAAIQIVNMTTGRIFQAGQVRPDILAKSFRE